MLKEFARRYVMLTVVVTLLSVAATACTKAVEVEKKEAEAEIEVPATVLVPQEAPATVVVEKPVTPTPVPLACETALPPPGRAAYASRGRVRFEEGLPLEEEQTLEVAIKNNIGRIRPWTMGTDIGQSYISWVFMGLTQFGGPKGELRAGIALGYTLEDDGVTYTWCLDPQAVYHDGTPVTAQSIKHAWEWSAYPSQQVVWGANLLYGMTYIEGFDGVASGEATQASGLVVVDDHTLQTVLAEPHAPWPSRLAVWLNGVFKAECYEEDMIVCEKHPVGVGPYEAEIELDSGAITLTAAENWWREPPIVQRVEMVVVEDQLDHKVMIENNELDIVYADAFETPWAYDPDTPLSKDLQPVAGSGMWMWVFDTTKPPFDDIKVRKAITHAIDWESIVQTVYQPSSDMARGFQGPQMLCFNPAYADVPYGGYDYDPDKARAALAESSYDAADFPAMIVAMNRARMVQAMEMARDMVKDNLGLDITVIPLKLGQREPPDANIYRRAAASIVPDPSSLMTELGHTANSWSKGSNHINPELDALIDRANSLPLDDPDRCGAYQEAERLFYDQYYMMMGLGLGNLSWLVRPWMLDFEVTYGLNWSSLPWMRIGKRDLDLWK